MAITKTGWLPFGAVLVTARLLRVAVASDEVRLHVAAFERDYDPR